MGEDEIITRDLKEWCDFVDGSFWNLMNSTVLSTNRSEWASHIPTQRLSILPFDVVPYLNIPCHGEFLRYAQWHDLAVQLIERKNLPLLTVHYESYATHYNRTVSDILDFLGQEWLYPPKRFVDGKTYRDTLFTTKQQDLVKSMIKDIVKPATWNVLMGYFSQSHSTQDVESRK